MRIAPYYHLSMLLLRNLPIVRYAGRRFFNLPEPFHDTSAYDENTKPMVLVPKVEQNLYGLILKLQPQVTQPKISSEQRAIWDVIRGNNHLFLRSTAQSGKSLAIAVMALNRALTHAPDRLRRLLDTVIVVPTDSLVEKYKYYLETSMAGLPELCCPFRETQESDIEYEPFSAKFVDSEGNSSSIATGESGLPQVLVLTPTGLHNLLSGSTDIFSTVRLVALDDFDFMMSSTGCGNSMNFVQKGENGRIRSKLVESVKQMYRVHHEAFVKRMEKRLHEVELRYASDTDFAASDFVLKAPIDESIDDTGIPKGINKKLAQKLFSLKPGLVYRPIQYCITAEQTIPMPESIDGSTKTAAEVQHLTELHSKETSFHHKLRKLIDIEETSLDNHKQWADLFVGNYPTFYLGAAKSKSTYRKTEIKPIELNYLQGLSDNVTHLSELKKYCLNDNQKKYLRKRAALKKDNDHTGFEVLLNRTLLKFYSISKNSSPFLIVLPPSVPLNSISQELGPKFPIKTINDISSETPEVQERFFETEKSHLCIHPHHLIGQSFLGVQNFLVIGQDSLLAATAFDVNPNAKHLLGLLNPNMDLLCFYLKKLMASRSAIEEANLVFIKEEVARSTDKEARERIELDSVKLEQILLASDIRRFLPIKSF